MEDVMLEGLRKKAAVLALGTAQAVGLGGCVSSVSTPEGRETQERVLEKEAINTNRRIAREAGKIPSDAIKNAGKSATDLLKFPKNWR